MSEDPTLFTASIYGDNIAEMNYRFRRGVATVLFLAILIVGCARQPYPHEGSDVPGFGPGYWHGLTAVLSLIGHIFNENIRIYNFPNSGGWYDYGFVLGVCSIVGGGVLALEIRLWLLGGVAVAFIFASGWPTTALWCV